jgi:holo-[acyl-carrier protein] synthase
VIVGVGTDVVEIARFARRPRRFLERLFTAAERKYCDGRASSAASYAARFAAKEAVLKALGTGLTRAMRWRDVEVVRAASGRVEAKLAGEVARRARGLTIQLSISHAGGVAVAVAVASRRRPRRPARP